jgi:hypothetical protein
MPDDDKFYKALRTRSSRDFLHSLYSLPAEATKKHRDSRKDLINKASAGQIKILIQVLRRILLQSIPVQRHFHDKIKLTRIVPTLQRLFLTTEGYAQFKVASLDHQREQLSKIGSYHHLLYNLFK